MNTFTLESALSGNTSEEILSPSDSSVQASACSLSSSVISATSSSLCFVSENVTSEYACPLSNYQLSNTSTESYLVPFTEASVDSPTGMCTTATISYDTTISSTKDCQKLHNEVCDREDSDSAGSGEGNVACLYSIQNISPPSIDKAFIKIPYESLLRTFRNLQRQVEKDMTIICYFIERKLISLSSDGAIDLNLHINKVNKLIDKLEALKNKIDDSWSESEIYIRRCQKRLRRLSNEVDIQEIHKTDSFSFDAYQERISWILYEFLERKGLSETAEALRVQKNVDDFVDKEIHQSVHVVIRALKDHNTKPALDWCAQNKFKLRKISSTFETEVHLQNALQFILDNKTQDAIDYIKANVTAEEFESSPDMKKVMAIPALLNDPPTSYDCLLGAQRWNRLIKRFQEDCAKVYGYPSRSSIEIILQAGFSAIKSQVCSDHKSASCPACQPEWSKYLAQIPTPHRSSSCLICSISGEIMNDDNPPLAGPNGHVYCQQGLNSLAAASDGYIECPRTKEKYSLSDFHKIFVT